MASGVKLILTMETADGNKNFTYNYVSSNPSISAVKTLGTALITNGSIFVSAPTATKAAKLVTTTEQDYDLS